VPPAPKLAYAQARIQARHGERLSEAGWRRLESAKSAAQFLDLARSTSLAPWAGRVVADMEPHGIERGLRAAWRETVGEVADWMPAGWPAAVRLYAMLPELPIRDHLARGQPLPPWLEADEALREAPVKMTGTATVGADLLARWRESLPPLPHTEAKAAQDLVGSFFACFKRTNGGAPAFPCRPPRPALEAICLRAFRRHAGSPVAVFAHLSLALLDFERFRGELLRRKLFAVPGQRSGA
jgi:hypothetical protein